MPRRGDLSGRGTWTRARTWTDCPRQAHMGSARSPRRDQGLCAARWAFRADESGSRIGGVGFSRAAVETRPLWKLGPPRRSIRREAACGSTYTRSEHTIPSSTGDPTRAEPGH